MKLAVSKYKRIIFFLAALTAGVCLFFYLLIWSPNTSFDEKSKIIFIENPEDVASWLESTDVVDGKWSFAQTARLKKMRTIKPGRYRISKNMSNNAMVNMLRSGRQEALSIRLDDVKEIEALAGRLGKKLQYDSAAFIHVFTDPEVCSNFGFQPLTIGCMFLPDTYEFFWTTTPAEFMARMNKIYQNYWTAEKKMAAEKLGLDSVKVGILASIVKAETANKEEAPTIARLYLNRLNMGMALQSDPTATFGRKEHAQRVYLSDLKIDSPYNTYLHTGLPPGPINFAETIYLDAVLKNVQHKYLFMCAQPGGTGRHNFASTLEQHNVNRRAYTAWLESKGIR